MISISISGHRPDGFITSHYTTDAIKKIANDMVFILKKQYGDSLMFNLGGAIGVDQWVGDACIEHDVPFKLYLPFLPEVQSKYWKEEQKEKLIEQVNLAAGLIIIDPSGGYNAQNYQIRNIRMIDDSNILIAFWVGQKRGGTFNAIKYALKSSKFALNALNNLKPVFSDDLLKGWTPPTVKRGNDDIH
jgi:uncharacterized phage-like protein YoqJ